jgi:hypothetical protein
VPGAAPNPWTWLTLDPTPVQEVKHGELFDWFLWLQNNVFDSRVFWRQLIMEYTPEQQALTLSDLARRMMSRHALPLYLTLVGIVGLWLSIRVGWRWLPSWRWLLGRSALRQRGAVAPYLQRLLVLLRRHLDLELTPGQTPRELAAQASAALAPSVAEVPLSIVAYYNASRFGAQPLSAADRAAIEERLRALQHHLAGKHPG